MEGKLLLINNPEYDPILTPLNALLEYLYSIPEGEYFELDEMYKKVIEAKMYYTRFAEYFDEDEFEDEEENDEEEEGDETGEYDPFMPILDTKKP